MTPEEVLTRVTVPSNPKLKFGRLLYDFVTENSLSRGLEIASEPGLTTVYLAGAVEGQRDASITSMWKTGSKSSYDVPQALRDANLVQFASLHEDATSGHWELMRFLRAGLYESFDFCVIHGGTSLHNVEFACSMMERLLKPNGWLILSNLKAGYRGSKASNKVGTESLSKADLTARRVREAFDLLVMTNPYFGVFRRQGDVGFAQKTRLYWTPDVANRINDEVAIGNAVDRALVDPEYRDSLIRTPRRAMAYFLGDTPDEFPPTVFVETSRKAPSAPVADERGTTTVYLQQPSWGRTTDEETLVKMLED